MVRRLCFFQGVVALIICIVSASVYSAQEPEKTAPEPMSVPAQKTQTSSAKPKKPRGTRTIETQVSGFTSQDADQLYLRVSLSEKRNQRDWFVRGAYIRTVAKSGNTSWHVTTQKVDSRLENSKPDNGFSVWTAVLSRRDRNRVSKNQPKKSGYHLLSYGVGKQLGTKMKGDVGLGFLEDYDNGTGTKPVLVASLRGRHSLNPKLALESDILLLQSMEKFRATKVDSDISLVHEFAPGLSLRLGWSVNNLIRSVRGSREWDSILRLVIGYRHTSAI